MISDSEKIALEFVECINAQDVEGLVALMTEDHTFIGCEEGDVAVGRKRMKEGFAQYFEAYPGIERWLEKVANDAVALGYSLTPMGRKRYFRIPDETTPDYKRKIGSIQRQGKNTPIQGANADMTKLALVYIQQQLWKKNYDAKLINTVMMRL